MVTLILIASMALWKISPHVINVSIIRILTARLVAVVCYYVSVHCAGPSEHLGTVGICLKNFWSKAAGSFSKYCFLGKYPSDPSSIYSYSIGHIWEHWFCHLGSLGRIRKFLKRPKFCLSMLLFGVVFNDIMAKKLKIW